MNFDLRLKSIVGKYDSMALEIVNAIPKNNPDEWEPPTKEDVEHIKWVAEGPLSILQHHALDVGDKGAPTRMKEKVWQKKLKEAGVKNPPKITSVVNLIHPLDKKEIVKHYDRRVKRWLRMKKKNAKPTFHSSMHLAKVRKVYNWRGRTGESLFQAVAKQIDSEIKGKDTVKVYRAAIMMPLDDKELRRDFRKIGLGVCWSTYKEGADVYVPGKKGYQAMYGAKQFLMEGEAHISSINWLDTFTLSRLGFPEEREINMKDDIIVKRIDIYSLDQKARSKYLKWETTGKNWKPWVDPSMKPERVIKLNKMFPTDTKYFQSTPLNPPQHELSIIYGEERKNPPCPLPEETGITIYGRDECIWCDKAKAYVTKNNLKHKYVDMGDMIPEYFKVIGPLTNNYKMVPAIFIDGKFIGGYSELVSRENPSNEYAWTKEDEEFHAEHHEKGHQIHEGGKKTYYHGSPIRDLTVLRKESYVTPDYETAYQMGRYHLDTGKPWMDVDLSTPHMMGTLPQFKEGREPKGKPTVYVVELTDDEIIDLDNPFEHQTLEEVEVTRMNPSMDDITKRVYRLSEKEQKTLLERLVKLMEESGELAEEALIATGASGSQYKEAGKDGVRGETADAILILLSIYQQTGGSVEDLIETLDKKSRKWESKMDPITVNEYGSYEYKGTVISPTDDYFTTMQLTHKQPMKAKKHKTLEDAKKYIDKIRDNPSGRHGESNIHGTGTFATESFSEGQVVITDPNELRYVNHSSESNLIARYTAGEMLEYIAKHDIDEGEEITLNYSQLAKLTGHPHADSDTPETLFNPTKQNPEGRHEWADEGDDPFSKIFAD